MMTLMKGKTSLSLNIVEITISSFKSIQKKCQFHSRLKRLPFSSSFTYLRKTPLVRYRVLAPSGWVDALKILPYGHVSRKETFQMGAIS